MNPQNHIGKLILLLGLVLPLAYQAQTKEPAGDQAPQAPAEDAPSNTQPAKSPVEPSAEPPPVAVVEQVASAPEPAASAEAPADAPQDRPAA